MACFTKLTEKPCTIEKGTKMSGGKYWRLATQNLSPEWSHQHAANYKPNRKKEKQLFLNKKCVFKKILQIHIRMVKIHELSAYFKTTKNSSNLVFLYFSLTPLSLHRKKIVLNKKAYSWDH